MSDPMEWEKDTTPTYIFNPTSDDITTSYDVDERGEPQPFTIKSRDSGCFPKYLADHIAKKIRSRMCDKKDGIVTDAMLTEMDRMIYL